MTSTERPLSAQACPHSAVSGTAESDRLALHGEVNKEPYELLTDGGRTVLVIRSFDLARQILRRPEGLRQAGFNVEVLDSVRGVKLPVLYQEGSVHRAQRRAIARFFTPKAVNGQHAAVIDRSAQDVVNQVTATGEADLDALIFPMATLVAAEVIGLTASNGPAMARRLERFFSIEVSPGASRWRRISSFAAYQVLMADFYLRDVRPAIAQRRKRPQSDLISSLLEQGSSTQNILIECITYAAAGMVTTREFASMTAWHLLEQPSLRAEYLAATKDRRLAMLSEMLRLEPVAGELLRETTQPLSLSYSGQTIEVPQGALIKIRVNAINADPEKIGPDGDQLCWGRSLPAGVSASVMGFGDGHHECPGQFLALAETDALMTKLLAAPVELLQRPRVRFTELVRGYEIRGLRVGLRNVKG